MGAWGANAIRLRFDSTDITEEKWGWSTDQYIACIHDWVNAAKAEDLSRRLDHEVAHRTQCRRFVGVKSSCP